MRISHKMGLYGGKQTAVVSIYGAATEPVTITHSDGTTYTAVTNDSGYGGELELPFGSYAVYGDVSKVSKTATVDKTTTRINAWMDDATIYFWHGAAPAGAWSGDDYVASSNITEYSKWSTENGKLYVEAYSKFSNAIIGTSSAVDLTGIDQLHFAVDSCNANNSYFVVSPTKDLRQKVIEYRDPNSGNHTVTLDVSALTGVHYIAFFVHVYDYLNTRTCTVSRVWGTIDPSGTIRSIEKSIAIGSTYRYANSLIAGDWVKVSSLSFGSINYVGQGTEDYNAMMVPVSAFTYSGTFKNLRMALHLWTSDKNNHTFRWAVTTSTANAQAYKVGSGAVTDSYQLGQGTWTPPYSDSYQWFTIDLDCEAVASGVPLYIYLWRDNNTYGNIHVTQSAVVTLNYAKA